MYKVSENPFKNRVSTQTVFLTCVALFCALYIVSNIMAVKVISLFGLFYFDAGTITFPLAYMLGDVITELWGYRTARRVIFITLFCNVLMVLNTQLGVILPSPEYMAETAAAYDHIFSYVPRIVLASLVGFLLGELSNAKVMEYIKHKTKGRKLWVRTIGSSMVGYLFDSLPFVLIGFAGTVSTHDLVMMILFQYFSKLAIETLFGTPLAYAAIGWIKRYTDYNETIRTHRG
ncbi:MAG: queuosine precursor transporter [Alistipes sp.]|nr:queuosine precursor transporter [Alistipes sp.]